MQARILNQEEEHIWSRFLENHPLATIHQTSLWGHFQEKIPARGKYWIIVLEDTAKIIAGTLLIRHSLPKGYCWLYAARGPLLNYDEENNYKDAQLQMDELLKEIKKIARQEKAIFLRVDPPLQISCSIAANSAAHYSAADSAAANSSAASSSASSSTAHSSAVSSHSAIAASPTPAPSHPSENFSERSEKISHSRERFLKFHQFHRIKKGFQPDDTLILDLSKSEQQLFSEMKPKGRYNIKLAEKKGVKIRRADPANSKQFSQDLKDFYQILTQTTLRDGFHGHDIDFYRKMLESLGVNFSSLYLAQYDGKIIAGSINTYFKDTATYYYGASGSMHRNLMAPYFLHWQAIKDARTAGYKYYDLFGIAPTNENKSHASHPWAGVTEFKLKFGGTEISYQKPQEYPFNKTLHLAYRLYKMIK